MDESRRLIQKLKLLAQIANDPKSYSGGLDEADKEFRVALTQQLSQQPLPPPQTPSVEPKQLDNSWPATASRLFLSIARRDLATELDLIKRERRIKVLRSAADSDNEIAATIIREEAEWEKRLLGAQWSPQAALAVACAVQLGMSWHAAGALVRTRQVIIRDGSILPRKAFPLAFYLRNAAFALGLCGALAYFLYGSDWQSQVLSLGLLTGSMAGTAWSEYIRYTAHRLQKKAADQLVAAYRGRLVITS